MEYRWLSLRNLILKIMDWTAFDLNGLVDESATNQNDLFGNILTTIGINFLEDYIDYADIDYSTIYGYAN